MTAARALVVIPARWGSTRLPGKPLVEVAGRTLLSRVVGIARAAATGRALDLMVATDDDRVAAHARDLGVDVAMTAREVSSGSGRVLAAVRETGRPADLLVNLQGDALFTPPAAVAAVVRALGEHPEPVATPVVPLDWDQLDRLREHKRAAPHSGTTCVTDEDGRAVWFSKAIIPAIRDEAYRRAAGPTSPVLQHIGLYGYRRWALERFEAAPRSRYEEVESLEQLRFLALGLPIRVVEVAGDAQAFTGLDTAEDLMEAERLIAAHGDPAG